MMHLHAFWIRQKELGAILDIVNMTRHYCSSAVLVLIPRFGTWCGPNCRANSRPCDIENGAEQRLCLLRCCAHKEKNQKRVILQRGVPCNAVALWFRCAQLEAVPFRGRLLRTLQRLGLAIIVQGLIVAGPRPQKVLSPLRGTLTWPSKPSAFWCPLQKRNMKQGPGHTAQTMDGAAPLTPEAVRPRTGPSTFVESWQRRVLATVGACCHTGFCELLSTLTWESSHCLQRALGQMGSACPWPECMLLWHRWCKVRLL